MDRAYLDYKRLYSMNNKKAFFITRTKVNTKLKRIYSITKAEKETINKQQNKEDGIIICDQTVSLIDRKSKKRYPDKLRRIKYKYKSRRKNKYITLTFITNNFTLSPLVIAKLYKNRWRIELFFKWIKQHLKIKKFYAYSENGIKTQIWTAICTYLLVAIIKKQLKIEKSMYEILQILSINIFEKTLINQLLGDDECKDVNQCSSELPLFKGL